MNESAPAADAPVTLREITKDTVRHFFQLEVSESQTQFVANNAKSIAQAYFEPKAWFRGVYAGDTPVGFIMLYDDPDEPEYYLWRFMIDQRYQRRGYGKQAIEALIDYVRKRPNAKEIFTSCVPGPGTPQPFYEGLGFEDTGKVDEGENVLRRPL